METVESFNKVALLPWWAYGKLLQAGSISKLVLKIFDKSVWFWRRLDVLMPWPGLSLMAVGRKPSALNRRPLPLRAAKPCAMPIDATALRPAIFFDRDGTLMGDAHYCADPALVRVFPGVPEALRRLKSAGFLVIIVTNQSGIGRGLLTEDQYRAVQAEFLRQAGGDSIDASYYCPDAPGVPSKCRKPEPGMVLAAATEYRIDLAASYFVGDKAIDIECGRRAGTRTILVLTGYGAQQTCDADFTCRDAIEAAGRILTITRP